MEDKEFLSSSLAKLAYDAGYPKNIEDAYYIQGSEKLFKTWDSNKYKYASFDGGGFIYPAPLHQQVISWCLEKHDVAVYLQPTFETPMRWESFVKFKTDGYLCPMTNKEVPGLHLCNWAGHMEEGGWLYHSHRTTDTYLAFEEALKIALNYILKNKIK